MRFIYLVSIQIVMVSSLCFVSTKGAFAANILNTRFGPIEIFPPDNPWNQDVSKFPVHPNSTAFINSIGAGKSLHPDFGSIWDGAPMGFPACAIVTGNQKKVPVHFEYPAESDSGPYPIPPDALTEGGPDANGDRHVIVIDQQNRKLYELFDAHKAGDGWKAGSGAVFDLTTNALRPAGWTSADAAGLPIFPGLVRYDEVVTQKEIHHALRFTTSRTQQAYIEPARHFASKNKDKKLPPMGLRVRLKADFDISGYPAKVQVILKALKTYGMILADNGGDLFISGVHDMRWNNDELGALKRVQGRDFEAVFTGEREM